MDEEERSSVVHPHDLLVRKVLADTDIAADLLRHHLDPELVSTLDLGSLKREAGDSVSRKLSKLMGDLRYSARFKGGDKELKLFVCLEHQSRPDRFMAFRMLGYIHAAYEQILPSLKKGERFPYPLAVVLHHGVSPWKKIPPMRELIDMTPGVEGDILGVPIRLIDVATMSLDELHGHPMVCALLDSLQSASTGQLPSRMYGILARLRGLGREKRTKAWVTALAEYYAAVRGEVQNIREDLTHVLTGVYDTEEAEKMATTMYEAIQREGRVEGRVEGKAEAIVSVLKSRFGAVPATVQRKLMKLRDSSRVEAMLELAVACQSLKEFQKAL